jgi:hypothetical protein
MTISREEFKERIRLHQQTVQLAMQRMIHELEERSREHDLSKYFPDEFEGFYAANHCFQELVFGSEDWKKCLNSITPIRKIHYSRNPHHPEAHENGIAGMTLMDILEMLADWKSASSIYGNNGNLENSILINKERFKIDDQLYQILLNTIRHMDWVNNYTKEEEK